MKIFNNTKGQTALILILLTAAALIFLSITLNWGRIAQTKSLLTIAADQSASLLASDAASYGEMEKQSNLQDTNEISALSGIIMDIVLVIVAIIVLIIVIVSWGSAFELFVAVIALIAAVANLVLQLVVVQPGMCALWNALQKNQPITQQFYEGGIGAALQGAVTDQTNITDYFDSNTNGRFGMSGGVPNDTVGRFAFFYTDRLKMLNKGTIPQVVFFYNQLGEFMNGETCAQNAIDHNTNPGIPINPICKKLEGSLNINCGVADAGVTSLNPVCQTADIATPSGSQLNPVCTDTACQMPIPNGFQLNDSCADSDPTNQTTYNPYCDPCCQPLIYKGKGLRPTSCYPYTSGYPVSCYAQPKGASCNLTATCTADPTSDCCLASPTSSSCLATTGASNECTLNNPFGSLYPYLYDPTYQEYSNGISFLDQFGRDQQQIPSGSPLPLTSMSAQGNFPDGLYPYFWLMKNYSPEVDDLTSSYTTSSPKVNLIQSQVHWCVAPTANNANQIYIPDNYVPPSGNTLTAFPDLTQLGTTGSAFALPYSCKGPNCCVNFLIDSDPTGTSVKSNTDSITVGSGISLETGTNNGGVFTPGTSFTAGNDFAFQGAASGASASVTTPVDINSVNITIAGQGQTITLQNGEEYNLTPSPPASPVIINGDVTIPICTTTNPPVLSSGEYTLEASATEVGGASLTPASVTISVAANGTSCSGASCGTDSCGNICPPGCTSGETCVPTDGNPGDPGTCSANPGPGAGIGPALSSSSHSKTGNSWSGKGVSLPSSPTPQAVTPSLTSPTITLVATDTSGNVSTSFPADSTIILQATVSNFTATAVTFFSGSNTFLGTVTGSGPTYSLTLNDVQSSFNAYAVADNGTNSPATTTSNGVIDEVGNPSFGTNPAKDTIYGQPNTSPALSWLPGDNQMCTTTWPYNGKSTYFPDGSCELTGTAITAAPSSYPAASISKSTVDQLDDVMHTLSDFDKVALSVMDTDLGTLNSTFDTWYSQVSPFIANACSGASACSESDFDAGLCPDTDCNQGADSNGRLLSIYDPSNPSVDVLKSWNNNITAWLANNYTPSSATSSTVWCVPEESSLEIAGVPTSEDNYINTNSGTTTWGDLPHVISCLNYNAGPNMSSNSNYQQCLGQLTTGTCPTILPSQCPPHFEPTHGCDDTYGGSYANWLYSSGNLATDSVNQLCLNALTSELTSTGKCSSSTLPFQCAALGSPPKAWSSTDSTRCDVYIADSYANWASNGVNYGPVYNYQNCLNLLANACPTSSVANTVCDPSVLGRSLLNSTIEPQPVFSGSNRCNITSCADGSPCGSGGTGKCSNNKACSVTYGQWVNDSMNLFIDETPKFALRSQFLTDIYNRATDMQNIFSSGDTAMHNFLKTCTGCADGTGCNAGTCDDGSACGPPSTCTAGNGPCVGGKCIDGSACCDNGNTCTSSGQCGSGGPACNYCANGGPAAQLTWARNHGNPARSLPNSVIYGWVDQTLPNGQVLPPGTSVGGGTAGGYAHIVKVTAYSAGRDGPSTEHPPAGIQSRLPWIQSWTTVLDQKYGLQARDGDVYVSIRRWDQDHVNPVNFPNGHPLWKFMFHNSSGSGNGYLSGLSQCFQLNPGNILSTPIGYGLEDETIQGLNYAITHAAGTDRTTMNLLANAFMLNDNGNGEVDSGNLTTGGTCLSGNSNNSKYCACVNTVNQLLDTGVESHACARYIGSINASEASSNPGDGDYSLKFVDCSSIESKGQAPQSSP